MQTIEFETAKKLKKLGLTRKGFLEWLDMGNNNHYLSNDKAVQYAQLISDEQVYPAYQLHEILEMLPYTTSIYKTFDNYQAIYVANPTRRKLTNKTDYNIIDHENPAEAAAQLLIWCIENNYITKEEINNDSN